MAIGLKFLDGEKYIQGANYIIHLREHSMLAVDHGVGSGTLFGEVHHGFGLKGFDDRTQEFIVGYIADKRFDGFSGKAAPGTEALRKRSDGSKRHGSEFVVPKTTEKVIDNSYFMSFM